MNVSLLKHKLFVPKEVVFPFFVVFKEVNANEIVIHQKANSSFKNDVQKGSSTKGSTKKAFCQFS